MTHVAYPSLHPAREKVLNAIRDVRCERLAEALEALSAEEGDVVYALALEIMTDLQMSPDEARAAWDRVAAHGQKLREALGRPVALATAALDYFTTQESLVHCPRWIELESFERIARSAISDGLTDLYNGAYFRAQAQNELEKARRYGTPFTVVLFDLDNLKKVNDTYGHLTGDAALIAFASCMRETVREMDLSARYGGEEFAVLLPNTKTAGAIAVAERIRVKMAERVVLTTDGQSLRVTVSGGVASYEDTMGSVNDLVAQADRALYAAKDEGRNRIRTVHVDQRQFVRIPASVRVHYRPMDAQEWQRQSAPTEDVSKGGVYFVSGETLPEGTVLRLQLELPESYGTVNAIAQVVHTRKSADGEIATGVRFLAVEPEDRTRINRFVWDQWRELRALDTTVATETSETEL